jgi:hypothetical protein
VSTIKCVRSSAVTAVTSYIPWFTRRSLFRDTLPLISRASSTPPSSSNRRLAFAHEMGRLGILGMLEPSVRVAFLYAGTPGVVGSPGYELRYCTDPR